ncbi:MAG: amino acid adenylation domain-containing protein [Flavobacterium sp.]|nr:MAG: amino acid adenylation domain-containing protein [Flavobacterium sp.]
MTHNSESVSLLSLIQERVDSNPNKTAIVSAGDEISYQQLWDASDRLAGLLLESGLVKTKLVAIAMERSLYNSITMLSLLKLGIPYLPIDPQLPLEMIEFMIDDAQVETLITEDKLLEKYHQFKPYNINELLNSDKTTLFSWERQPNNQHNLIYVVYTSGSTGRPKGIGVQQQNLQNLMLHRIKEPGICPKDNMLGLNSLSFDIAQEEFYLPLVAGAKLTIVDRDIARDGQALLETIKNENITFMQATPYIWQMIIAAGWNEKLPLIAFSGGEVLTNQLASQLVHRCKSLWNMYGPTETTICAMAKKIETGDELITLGRPINGVSIYVLDKNNQPVQPNKEGELYIGGAGVTPGYINRPVLNQEKFILNPLPGLNHERIYRTGDLVKLLSNGELVFIGRADNQIKLRGHRIETEEIEKHVTQNTVVNSAIVTLYEDQNSIKRLAAYVVTNRQSGMSNQEIEDQLKNRLALTLPYYMLPAVYVFIDEMPLLPSGKVNKKALPLPHIETLRDNSIAKSDLEKMLVNIWSTELAIKNIGINANFFDLGGTSLIALKTKIQIEKQIKKRLSPSILFKFPTIGLLADHLNECTNNNAETLVALESKGSKIPLYLVHGAGLNIMIYKSLSDHLVSQPVFAIQAVYNNPQIYDNIASIAAYYNSEILKHDPNGPFLIGGYSIGGVIAFEMAKQLKAKNLIVKGLIIIDTNLQNDVSRYSFSKKLKHKLIRQFLKFAFRIRSFEKSPVATAKYLTSKYFKNIQAIWSQHPDYPKYPDYMLSLITKIKKAYTFYRFEPIDVQIDLFIAENLFFVDDPKTLGWSKFAKGGVNTYRIKGNHAQIFVPPFDAHLANILQHRLDQLNRQDQDIA